VKREQLIVSLRQIEALTGDCLAAAGEKLSGSPTKKPSTKVNKRAKNALPDRIIDLRDKGVFAQAKTAREVHEKLSTTYPCDLNRVGVALARLVKRKMLRKASKVVDGKKQVAYAW
jgi:hypothetical protein